jgi:hypothetical protein
MDRRSFLSNAGLIGAVAVLGNKKLFAGTRSASQPILDASSRPVRFSDREIAIPDTEWRMWPDQKAA